MPKAGGPTTEQLLELLQRAAAELVAERKRREEAEASLTKERTVGGVHPQMREQLDEVQDLYQKAKVQAEQTRGELHGLRQNLVDEVAAQREMKSALERENNAHSQTRAALEAEQNAHLQTRTELEQERTEGGIAKKVAKLKAEQEAAEHQRVAELSEQLATAAAERDTLIARLDSIEAARKTDREIEDAKVKELEDKHAQAIAAPQALVTEAQAVLAQEKEKHQQTAQKFLTEKGRVGKLEAQLQEVKTRVTELESATVAAAEAHAKELQQREAEWRAAEAAHVTALATMQAQLSPMQQQLEATAQERFYVERKYEELSRELQITLDQRDEARRILENVQAERQRLERALQQR